MKKTDAIKLFKLIIEDADVRCAFKKLMVDILVLRKNPFHPLVFISGNPEFGKNVYIGLFSEIYSKGAQVKIGDNCDIASFVAINCADSHKKGLGLLTKIEKKNITLENNVFVGSHSVIKGGAYIGHHTVIGAGTIVEGITIPPYSLVIGNPMTVKKEYYLNKI